MDAIYARQSLDKKDSISIETQIELCLRELTPKQKHIVYADKGYSGSTLNRPEFQRMMADIKSGRIERIITYRLDRISRSVLDFSNLIDLFDRYGVSFNSTQEKFDTSTPIGKAMLNITMVFAQLERETIQRRIKDNYYSRGEKGMYLGGPPPFGFVKVTEKTEQGNLKMLRENTDASPLLEEIFHMYGDELRTLGEIARKLNADKLPSPTGKNWDTSKLSRILRNPVYVKADADVYSYYSNHGCKFTNDISDFTLDRGCYLYGKRESHERKYTNVTDHTVSIAPHQGLISSDLFLRCQEKLDKNTQIDNRRKSKITWLTGLIKCKRCGYSIIPKSSNGGRYTYLYCTGKQTMHMCDVDGNLGNLIDVEALTEGRIFKWAKSYSSLKASIEVANGKERNKIQCRLLEIAQGVERLVNLALGSNTVTSEYLNKKISELEAERKELESKLDNLSVESQDSFSKEVADIPATWYELGIPQKNAIAALLINRIILSPNEIEVEWKYDFIFSQSYSNSDEC